MLTVKSQERYFTLLKVGEMIYSAKELGLTSEKRPYVRVYFDEALLSKEEVVKSFCHLPLTMEHESGFLDGSEDGEVIRGSVTKTWYNPATKSIEGVALITNEELLQEIEKGNKLEISGGWMMSIEPYGGNYKALEVVGNHVSVVSNGRCGSACCVGKEAVERLFEVTDEVAGEQKSGLGFNNLVRKREMKKWCQANNKSAMDVSADESVTAGAQIGNENEEAQEQSSTLKAVLLSIDSKLSQLIDAQNETKEAMAKMSEQQEVLNKVKPYLSQMNETAKENQKNIDSLNASSRIEKLGENTKQKQVDDLFSGFYRSIQ